MEKKYGENAVEAYILNRVFIKIRIDNGQTDEITTTLAVAYHQEGIQMAIGPYVKLGKNQCILSTQNTVMDYSKKGVSQEEMFSTVDGWLRDFDRNSNRDRKIIDRLKRTQLSKRQIREFIGQLNIIRVAKNSGDKKLLKATPKDYP